MKVGAVIPTYGKPHFLDDVTESLHWIDEIVMVNSFFTKDTEQAYVRNSGLRQLEHFDYIFVLDSDEILLEKDARATLDYAKEHPEMIAFGVPVVAYLGDLEHVIEYDGGHHPIVLIRGGYKLHNTRCHNVGFDKFSGATLHHLKFLQPLSALKNRTNTKAEKRKVSIVKDVPLNNDLMKAISASISDNTEYVLSEKWL